MKYQLTASNNTSVTVDLDKGQSGWQAETRIELGESRVLILSTRKGPFGNALSTFASVCTVKDGIQTHVLAAGPAGDFRQTVLKTCVARVTDKAVREQHERFLSASCALTDLLAQIEHHYAAQAQLRENKATSEVAHA